jgi:hypothetical protein
MYVTTLIDKLKNYYSLTTIWKKLNNNKIMIRTLLEKCSTLMQQTGYLTVDWHIYLSIWASSTKVKNIMS